MFPLSFELGFFTASHRADERAFGVELEQRVIASIEEEYVTLGIDGDADHFAHYVCGWVVEKVFDEMQG